MVDFVESSNKKKPKDSEGEWILHFVLVGEAVQGSGFRIYFFFFGISVEISGGGREKEKMANQQHNKQIKKKNP